MKTLATLLTLALVLTSTAMSAVPTIPVSYHSPQDGARSVRPQASIAVRAGPALAGASVQSRHFAVVGTASGAHTGRATLATDGQTAIFYPDQPFTPGETVSVVVSGLMTETGVAVAATAFGFNVAQSSLGRPISQAQALGQPVLQASQTTPAANGYRSFVTLPTPFPQPAVNTATVDIAPGYLFLLPFNFGPPDQVPSVAMIVDNSGEPIYLGILPGSLIDGDFKRQPDGTLSYFSARRQGFVILDATYTEQRLIQAGNGYAAETDIHDLQILPNGNALLMVYTADPFDLSPYGGRADAAVIHIVIQEIDPQGNVLFEWNSANAIEISDTYETIADVTLLDYLHTNAIEPDTDGNLMISNRHTADIIKLNRSTGQIMWRLGGKKNQFTFIGDSGFYYQHDIRRLPNGNISLFDNRTNKAPVFSRVVEYELDEVNKTARQVFQRAPGVTYSLAMGNMQALPNGNRLIGWGSGYPSVTEVTPSGQVALMLSFASPEVTYRAFRFPWTGIPAQAPATVVRLEDEIPTIYMSWNGSTQTSSWRIEGGTLPGRLNVLATAARTGFETRVALSRAPQGSCFFRVTALDAGGAALRSSAVTLSEAPSCAALAPSQQYLPLVQR